MTSLSTPYVCQRCISHLSRRPTARSAHAQWRNYAYTPSHSVTEQDFRIAKHFSREYKRDFILSRSDKAPQGARAVYLKSSDGLPRARHRQPSSSPRERRRRLRDTIAAKDGALIPSEPTPIPKIWASEKATAKVSLHFGTMEDWNWYWETIPPTFAQKTQANHFFTKHSAKFLRSVALFRAFPESDVPEVAFVGRSNVGKSSLLNAIVNADTKALLARTSSTPGFTKTMNLYGIGPGNGINIIKTSSGHDKVIGTGGLTIVDMPGYGEGSLSEWGAEIMKYLQGRKQLRRVFVLLDAQHGIKDKDRSLLASLRLGGIPHQVILSKLDKIYLPKAREIKRYDGRTLSKLKPKGSLNGLKLTMDAIRTEIQPPVGGSALGEILACSSDVLVDGKRLGADAVRFAMLQATGYDFGKKFIREAKEGTEKDVVREMKTNAPLPKGLIRSTKSDKSDTPFAME